LLTFDTAAVTLARGDEIEVLTTLG
ncbi:MAG: hypothetical protein QOK16_435, partial [Solirubrobacteraceae bacterium]|nr:hypothetical protein [Solirubrobacteraceae bacterium]